MSDFSERHDDSDSSNTFWPGYVDATTNLALNLLFLLTIMITAVFMFALEMGRTSVTQSHHHQAKPGSVVAEKRVDTTEQVVMLKLEVQRLKKLLAQQGAKDIKPGSLKRTIDATRKETKPSEGLEKLAERDVAIVVRFKDEAIALNPQEREEVLESLRPIVARGKPRIQVAVPAGFSEAKRMGFYRAMAVRNLLIEMKVPKESIKVSVVDGKEGANASLVMVR